MVTRHHLPKNSLILITQKKKDTWTYVYMDFCHEPAPIVYKSIFDTPVYIILDLLYYSICLTIYYV